MHPVTAHLTYLASTALEMVNEFISDIGSPLKKTWSPPSWGDNNGDGQQMKPTAYYGLQSFIGAQVFS
jgi:hypothetical protein